MPFVPYKIGTFNFILEMTYQHKDNLICYLDNEHSRLYYYQFIERHVDENMTLNNHKSLKSYRREKNSIKIKSYTRIQFALKYKINLLL